MNMWTCAVVVMATAGLVRADDPKEQAREAAAKTMIKALERACESYFINPNSRNTYPKELTDLVLPPWGGMSFLVNGNAELIDPWDNLFKYAVARDENGNEGVYIWSERTVDGKTKVVGKKPPRKT